MYYNFIVDHYDISKIIIIISIYACVYYTNHNTELSMAQLLLYNTNYSTDAQIVILYHTAESNTTHVQIF